MVDFFDPVSDPVLVDIVQTEALSVVLLLVDAGARGMGMVDGYVGVGWGSSFWNRFDTICGMCLR